MGCKFKRRLLFILYLLCFSIVINAQIQVNGTVVDAQSLQPLEYCHAGIRGNSGGSVSNADGNFSLTLNSLNDTISLSYVGYTGISISGSQLEGSDTIFLEPSFISLDEMFVYASDDYLYEAVFKCRNNMRVQDAQESKAYCMTETSVNDKSVEMLECYYNSNTKGSQIHSLDLKRGRGAVPLEGDKFFLNIEASKSFMMFELIEKNNSYPKNPLQFSQRKIKRAYKLVRLSTLSDKNTLHISFKPKANNGDYFSGECWIDKRDFSLQKIILTADSAEVHPFHLVSGSSIDHINLRIEQSFATDSNKTSLVNMKYIYELSMQDFRPELNHLKWVVNTESSLHFYDFGTTFLLPFFNFSSDHSDYRKISFIPYDTNFWNTTHNYVLTNAQKARLVEYYQTAELLNYKQDFNSDFDGLFEKNNAFWSDEFRLSFKKNTSGIPSPLPFFVSDQVGIHCQIYLDANIVDNTWVFTSAAVFDIFDSFNYIGETPLRNCYANIYFDLCEISKRELIEKLSSHDQTVESIKRIYDDVSERFIETTDLYKQEVQQGENLEVLKEWNDLIIKELGIDNISLFGLENNE